MVGRAARHGCSTQPQQRGPLQQTGDPACNASVPGWWISRLHRLWKGNAVTACARHRSVAISDEHCGAMGWTDTPWWSGAGSSSGIVSMGGSGTTVCCNGSTGTVRWIGWTCGNNCSAPESCGCWAPVEGSGQAICCSDASVVEWHRYQCSTQRAHSTDRNHNRGKSWQAEMIRIQVVQYIPSAPGSHHGDERGG